MKHPIRKFVEIIILLIAFGAGLYTQRTFVLDWLRESTRSSLPESVTYVEITDETTVSDDKQETDNDLNAKQVSQIVNQVNETLANVNEETVLTEPETIVAQESDNEEALDASFSQIPDTINLAVPFTSQAPNADWSYPYKEACEEASVYMVHSYYQSIPEGRIPSDTADKNILAIVDFEKVLFGFYEDTTVEQTAAFAELMYGYSVELIENPTVEQLKAQIAIGRPVIVPMAGRQLGIPYFQAPGPIYHMLVLRGYTKEGQFITNDPGTRHGEAFLYDFDTIMNAMHDWNGGNVDEGKKVVLIIY